jgi:hypothetical protein
LTSSGSGLPNLSGGYTIAVSNSQPMGNRYRQSTTGGQEGSLSNIISAINGNRNGNTNTNKNKNMNGNNGNNKNNGNGNDDDPDND